MARIAGSTLIGSPPASGKLPEVVSTQPAPSETASQPLETPFADAASPFKRTEVPLPVFAGPPPQAPLPPATQSSWVTYRAQINFGLAMLAYLMVLVGSITLIQANSDAGWRYYIAALPLVPALLALFVFVRSLTRLDDLPARIQLLAFGSSPGASAVL